MIDPAWLIVVVLAAANIVGLALAVWGVAMTCRVAMIERRQR